MEICKLDRVNNSPAYNGKILDLTPICPVITLAIPNVDDFHVNRVVEFEARDQASVFSSLHKVFYDADPALIHAGEGKDVRACGLQLYKLI